MWVIYFKMNRKNRKELEIPAYKKKSMQNWIKLVDYEEVK